jgi:ppGpp synthetase/RelA/SpoT-type nucleotidyltranferase
VYVVPTRIDRDTTLLVVLGYEPKELPSWVSLAFATMQIHFLAHRLVVSEADRRARLGAEAARLGLQLDADIAARIGVTAADLSHLHLWRTRCQQAILGVTHLTNFCLLANSAILPFAELIKVSSRVKAVDSILHKFLPPTKRIWPEYGQLEDIAGVRVICPTLSCLKIIEDFLVGQKAAAHGVRLHSTIVPSRRDYISSPTKSGYRAIHLILEVETYLGDEGVRNVPCEVQLRTTFQDVWAVISHATLYGADRKERRRHSDKLRDTALALEHSENLLEELISSEEK